MQRNTLLIYLFTIFTCMTVPVFSQVAGVRTNSGSITTDSVPAQEILQGVQTPEIVLTRDQAIVLLKKSLRTMSFKNSQVPLKEAIGQIVFEAVNRPFDSTAYFLKMYPWDKKSSVLRNIPADTLFKDSLSVEKIETTSQNAQVSKDSSVIVKVDTLKKETPTITETQFADSGLQFRSDSLKAAVGVLLNYLEARDSSLIMFTGISDKDYPMWLNSKSEKLMRFWLKNDLNDSVTVWIGNQGRNTLGLFLEHGVSFRRPSRQDYNQEANINVEKQDNSKLVNVRKIITKAQYWKNRTEASFALNQGYVSNWVKGGENSVSTALDITWFADYTNKPMLISSNHFARLKYGLIASGDGIRKNLDLLETNSKFNHKAFGKFDFSAIMLFKTQLSKGYSYPNDSVPVSKFMNPAVLTIGLGLDYKPNKLTSINFSPLSYKATFVLDTAMIDQTKYGVPKNRRSLHEPGASFMFSNEFKPAKNISVTNRLQLFTNYIHNPLNIDVDWEMILQANINWFTDVRLNTHLIFDDDTRTPVFDKEKNPVIGIDGLQKKSARVQFKEMLGFSFIFRF